MTDITDTYTQHKRDIELEYYREKLTEIANIDNPYFHNVAKWAERVLEVGESITGPGVDMTDEEREAAVKLLESTPEQ